MASAKGRKLKVFQAPFGFHESVVAAASRAAALRAWGSHQNLFAEGLAKLATDEVAIEAALAHPDTPLLRAVGSNDPFELEARSLPKVPDASKSAKRKEPAPTAKPEPPPADRSGLDAAETAMRELEDSRKTEEKEFRWQRNRLDREEAEAQASYFAAKKKADAALKAQRTAYRRAGGKD